MNWARHVAHMGMIKIYLKTVRTAMAYGRTEVCVFVCMYVCVYISMFVFIYLFMYM